MSARQPPHSRYRHNSKLKRRRSPSQCPNDELIENVVTMAEEKNNGVRWKKSNENFSKIKVVAYTVKQSSSKTWQRRSVLIIF